MTLAELDAQVTEISRDLTRQLESVPFEGRYGDWDALIRKHEQMLAFIRAARGRRGELQPPADRARAYRGYLAALDLQLALEEAVLSAARTRDFDTYKAACRSLAASMPAVRSAARRAGLRSVPPAPRHRARIWLTLPWYIVRALRHGRAERRAGRSWS